MIHRVQAGESLQSIAKHYTGNQARHVELMAVNPHKPRFEPIAVGEHIHLPLLWTHQLVVPLQTWSRIQARHIPNSARETWCMRPGGAIVALVYWSEGFNVFAWTILNQQQDLGTWHYNGGDWNAWLRGGQVPPPVGCVGGIPPV